MKQLPRDVIAYKKTKIFNEGNIPKALLNDHKTLAGVWGVINILKGKLIYVISEDSQEITLSQEKFGIVEPEKLHFVQPMGEVSFYVEFYK